MVEYTYEKIETPEGEPQKFAIHAISEENHTTTTTIEQEEALIAELEAKADFHKNIVKELKKL